MKSIYAFLLTLASCGEHAIFADCPPAKACKKGYSCQPNPVVEPPSDDVYLGTLPSSLQIKWPKSPTTNRTIEVSTVDQFNAEASKPGTKIIVKNNLSANIALTADDMEMEIKSGVKVQALTIEKGRKRIFIHGGELGSIELQPPIQFWPTPWVYKSEWMIEDVKIDGVKVFPTNGGLMGLMLRGKRIAVTNSDITAIDYSVWTGDTGDFKNEDLILAKNKFKSSSGGQSTIRLVGNVRSVVVDNRLQNGEAVGNKHNYRIHGTSSYNFAARNVLVNSGVMIGTQAGDSVDHAWFNDTVIYHNTSDLFNIGWPAVQNFQAKNNKAYTNAWGCFYCNPPKETWDFQNNLRFPYQAAP